MATPNRWAVREAAEATFYKVGTNTPVVTLKTLKMTEVTTNGETTYAMGGRGNAKLVGFSGNREARVTIQDAIFDNKALEMLTGVPISPAPRGKVVTETLPSGTGSFIISKAAALSVTYTVDGGAPATATSSVGGVVTAAGMTTGKSVVATYTTAPSAASTITVTSKDFAGTYKLVLDVVVRDLETGKDFYGQFIAAKVQVENEFTFSFSPDGDPSVLDIPIEILKPANSDVMYELVLFDNV